MSSCFLVRDLSVGHHTLSAIIGSNIQSTFFHFKSYGFFKIVATSSVTPIGERPGIFSMEKRAKWDAWKAAGETLPADCPDIAEASKLSYLNIVRVAMGAEALK